MSYLILTLTRVLVDFFSITIDAVNDKRIPTNEGSSMYAINLCLNRMSRKKAKDKENTERHEMRGNNGQTKG